MLHLYKASLPISGSDPTGWGWRENGRKGGREGKKILPFNVIEFTNVFLHGLDFIYQRNSSLLQFCKDSLIHVLKVLSFLFKSLLGIDLYP